LATSKYLPIPTTTYQNNQNQQNLVTLCIKDNQWDALLKMMNASYFASNTCLALNATHYAAEWIHFDAVHTLYGPIEDVVEVTSPIEHRL
jgi:hypothetical protein